MDHSKNILSPLFLVLMLLFAACAEMDPPDKISEIHCNIENYDKSSQKLLSNDSEFAFNYGYLRSEEEAFSGTYAIKNDIQNQFGLGLTLIDVDPDEYYHIRIWRKGSQKGSIVARDRTSRKFYFESNKVIRDSLDGWEQIELGFTIPPHHETGELLFNTWNPDTIPCYFDDLTIRRMNEINYPEYNEKPLKIYVDSLDIMKFQSIRKAAYENHILESTPKDFADAILMYDDKLMKAKIRLKGFDPIHVKDRKWSFLVQLNADFAWNSMSAFTLQNPEIQNFIYEWAAHRLFQKEDVLTTKYGFIPVYLNDKSLGYYAYEENFDNSFFPIQERIKGPILKFNETHFWNVQKEMKKARDTLITPLYDAAEIIPVANSMIMENPMYFDSFENAQNLMYNHKWCRSDIEMTYELDILAKYFALIDATNGYRGLSLINRHFYYNPVTGRLEPIALQCYSNRNAIKWDTLQLLGNIAFIQSFDPEILSITYIFESESFRSRYLNYLNKFSASPYMAEFQSSIREDRIRYNNAFAKEWPHFKYDTTFFTQTAREIRKALPVYESALKNEPEKKVMDTLIQLKSNLDTGYWHSLHTHFVNAYTEKTGKDSLLIKIENYNIHPIYITGTGSQDKVVEDHFLSRVVIDSYTSDSTWIKEIMVDAFSRYLFFKIDGKDDLYHIPVFPWSSPRSWSPQQELLEYYAYEKNDSIRLLPDNVILLKSAKYTFSNPWVIPQGYQVKMPAGCQIDLVDSAFILSYSPVYMYGTKSKPIIIQSSDLSGQGITVIKAPKDSYFKDAIFRNLNALHYKGWSFSGVINFYQSNVDIFYTTLSNNYCDDGLNIMDSRFNIRFCHFDQVYADAFDADFSNGDVFKTFFTNIPHNAMTFSGGSVNIVSCNIENVKNEAVSGGENARIAITDTDINTSKIALSAKDLSHISVENTRIKNSHFGLVAFEKKPVYGPASITTLRTILQNIEKDYLVEENSILIFNGDTIQGTEQNVKTLFYSKEEN